MLARRVRRGHRRRHRPARPGSGLLFAAVAGLIVAAVQANMSHRLPADQFVVGLVLNVLVLGLVGFLTS